MNRRTALATTATALASLALSPMTALAGNGEQKQDSTGRNCDMTCLPYLPSPGTIVDKSLLVENRLKQIETGITAREMIDFIGFPPSFIRQMPRSNENCVSYIFELKDGKVVYDNFSYENAIFIFDIDLASQKVVYCMKFGPLR